MTVQILSAVIGVFAFAVLFHAPRRSYLCCALCGGICWGSYLLFASLGLTEFLASTLAVLVLPLAARVLSVAMALPATTFVVCGIFPIVPGAGIYHTAYALMINDMAAFGSYGVETVSLAGAIAIGIVVGMGLPAIVPRALGRGLGRLLPASMRRR